MMAADGKRQQQRAADFPALAFAVQADRDRNRSDRGANQDRGGHQYGIPEHRARDLEGRHARVMHDGDAAGDDGTADPWAVTPAFDQRYREADAREQDGRDERQDG